jgi:hypothetical protein
MSLYKLARGDLRVARRSSLPVPRKQRSADRLGAIYPSALVDGSGVLSVTETVQKTVAVP